MYEKMTYYLPQGKLDDISNDLYNVKSEYIESLGYTLSILTINKTLYYRHKKIKNITNIELNKCINLLDDIINNNESFEDYLDRLIEMDKYGL